MKITQIPRLTHYGVFRDFQWPGGLPGFNRYNLIYGWNGSGKTLLSSVFRSLEQRQPPFAGTVSVAVDGQTVRGEDFPQATVPVRVFNRDFVGESVFPAGGGELPPIYVLGRESAEKQKEADKLKQELAEKESQLNNAQGEKRKAEEQERQFCTDHAEPIRVSLRTSDPDNRYSHFDRRRFRERATQMLREGDAETYRLSDEERDKLYAQHQASPKPSLREIAYRWPPLDELAESASQLLQATVASSVIQALKDDPALGEWTRNGLHLHRERDAHTCLFCEQPLPGGRLDQLEAHFSDEYDRLIKEVDRQAQHLRHLAQQAQHVEPPKEAELYDHLAGDYEAAQAELREQLQKVEGYLADLAEWVEGKKQKPFDPVKLGSQPPQIDPQALERVNSLIRRHNQETSQLGEKAAQARERLAVAMVADQLEAYRGIADAVRDIEEEVKKFEKESQRLRGKIQELEAEIMDHRPPVDELNRDLRQYLGHDDLQLEIQHTGYRITRNGEVADMLSEGERTAIALLYFLRSLDDREFSLRSGVVVLDDPVSSLDATALYCAFGFIKERVKDAAQLFIMTHNFLFFRQVRHWFKNNKREQQLYMVTVFKNNSQRCSTLKELDPLLREYESEYHYLFSLVENAAQSTDEMEGLDQYHHLPNVIRRLLEAFLEFKVPGRGLYGQLSALTFDDAKKARILRFCDTHSHNRVTDHAEQDPTVMLEAPAVARDVMELIQTTDSEHFNGMKELIS